MGQDYMRRLREGISRAWAGIIDVERRTLLGLKYPKNRLASIFIVPGVFQWEAEEDSKAKLL